MTQTETAAHTKQPLIYDDLRDVIDLSLWAGRLLLQHGAASQRVEETIHHLGTGLGCDWMDILISPNAIIITASSGQEFRTKQRRVVRLGVNMWVVTAVTDLSFRVTAGQLDHHQLRQALNHIDQQPAQYNRWLIVGMVGLACAAFSRLFGGDWPVFGITFWPQPVPCSLARNLPTVISTPISLSLSWLLLPDSLPALPPSFSLALQPTLPSYRPFYSLSLVFLSSMLPMTCSKAIFSWALLVV